MERRHVAALLQSTWTLAHQLGRGERTPSWILRRWMDRYATVNNLAGVGLFTAEDGFWGRPGRTNALWSEGTLVAAVVRARQTGRSQITGWFGGPERQYLGLAVPLLSESRGEAAASPGDADGARPVAVLLWDLATAITDGLGTWRNLIGPAELLVLQAEAGKVTAFAIWDSEAGGMTRLVATGSDQGDSFLQLWRDAFEGGLTKDETGRQVLAAAARVEGTPWAVVARQHRDAVFAGWRRRAAVLSFAGLLGAMGLAAFGAHYWWRRETRLLYARYLAEQEAAESRAQFQRVFDNAIVGLYRTTPEGEILLVNDALVKMLGYRSAEELKARRVTDDSFHPEHPRRRFLEAMEREGEVRGLESAWKRADGSFLYVRESAKAVRDESGRILYFDGVVEDISEKHRAEQALAESELKYRELVQNANSIILRMDRRGVITFINEFGLRFFGFSEDEILGRNVMDTIVPKEESTGRKLEPLIEEICRYPEKYANNINENICKDGRRVWIAWTNRAVVDENGELKEIFCVGTDITAQRRAEEALARERNLLRTLLDLLPVAVYAKDREGRKILANPVEARLMGLDSLQEALGKTDYDVYPKELADKFVQDDDQVLRRGEPVLNREQPLRLGDGTVRWFLVSKVPLRDSWGRIEGLVGVSVDVTDHRQAIQQLKETLKERTTLLREMHHRVKNNLQIVCSLVHLQKEQTTDPGTVTLLESTERRVRSMAMLHEVIYQSPSIARVPAAIYIGRLCDLLVSLVEPAVSERVRLHLQVPEVELPLEKALPVGLIVSELVSNAFKHAYPDGRRGAIHVRLQEWPAVPGGSTDGPRTFRSFELLVQDDGAGLSDWEAALAGGSLGLQLVRSLVRQLQGTLTHEGPPGTTFRIQFQAPIV